MKEKLIKIVIIGPESTGKSTLTKSLADYFNTEFTEEYAREYLNELDREYVYEDLLTIAKGQIKLEDEQSKIANHLLFCDTDLQVIKVWSEHKFGKVDDWILQTIAAREYDFYLLTDIDFPWEDDPQREHPDPEMREYFFNIYKEIVIESGIPFEILSGNKEERMHKALEILNRFLQKNHVFIE